jgi:hypothetical protein
LLPSWAFPLSQFPSVSSKARGTQKVPTQRMVFRSTLVSFLNTPLLPQCKVRRTPTAIPPTTALCLTYRGGRQEPDRPAPWLLRAPPRGTRHTPRRSTKSRSSEARPAWAGDPAEQRSHRGRRRLKEEGQAERWHNRSIGTRSYRRSCYRCSNDGINSSRGICGCHVGSSRRCDSTGDTHVEQRWLTEPAGGIGVDRPVSNGHGGNPCWLSATTGADTEEEESCTRSGHWRGRRCGSWDWWGWRYGQEARTAARGSATGCRSERVSLMRLEWSGRRSYFFGVVTYYCQFFVIYFCTL